MIIFSPCIIALVGPPLHGKSTVALALAKMSNLCMVDIDVVKAKHFSDLTAEKLDITAQAYQLMADEVAALVAQSQPIILSATFSRKEFKDPFLQIFRSNKTRVFFLLVDSVDCIMSRIKNRNSKEKDHPIKSEAQYRWALGLLDPWPGDMGIVDINADRNVDLIVRNVLDHCRGLILRG